MSSWIRAFRRAAHYPVRIWSLHNHVDVNRHRTSGTREFLRTTRRGAVWFTETGGIVNRYVDGRRVTRYHRANAAKAIKAVFRLARASRRVKRVYLYHWLPPRERRPRWDSALVDRRGKRAAVAHRAASRAAPRSMSHSATASSAVTAQ